MGLVIIQAGSALQRLDVDGNLLTLSLPTGVTIDAQTPPRWAVFDERLVLVNSPSRPLTIDGDGTVRVLTPSAPRTAPVLSGVTAGTLSGTYRARVTNRILDDGGTVVAESDLGPASAQATIANKKLRATLELSPDQITDRAVYRTTTDGAVYFGWTVGDGNVITSVEDDLSDASLQLLAVPRLGTPPRLVTIAAFRGRLFGTGDVQPDILRYTEAALGYAWPADNEITAPGAGADEFGIVGLAARKDALGFGRRNLLGQVTGTGREDTDGNVDFDPVTISNHVGFLSQETVKVFRDAAYFLWQDGVYRWNSEGVRCLSDGNGRDGTGRVRSWFATDDYFNRARYPYAFAVIDPLRPCYRLFLSSPGATVIDRWVEYDIDGDSWWGPHKTGLYTPTAAFLRTTSDGTIVAVSGSATAVYGERTTRTDGASTAIDASALSKRHDAGDPDREKFFGKPSVFTKAQASGTLLFKARVGAVNATTGAVDTSIIDSQNVDLTGTRTLLGRLGHGVHAQIELANATAAIDCEVYGYLIDPVHPIGRR